MRNWLNNKTVIITGASGGIGFNVAKILIEKYDCKVIGIARNPEKMNAAISTLNDKAENFTPLFFDVSKKENWTAFCEYLETKKITPDILFNNAGFMLPFKKFEYLSDEEIDEIINTNLRAGIFAVHSLIPFLKKSSSPAVINVASAAGNCAVVGESMYCATKFAVKGFTETLRQEYKKTMYVGGIYPGFIRTNILHRMSVDDKENKLINKLMMPVEKAAKKIVKGMSRKKSSIIMGIDGRSMSCFGRLFPKATPALVTKVLKSSGLDLFSDVFDEQ